MLTWIECGDGFIQSDVIRWKEGVFETPLTHRRRRRRKGHAICTGEREVIAEVLSNPDERGFVTLLTRGCQIISVREGRKVLPLKIETEIRRQQKTLLKGGVERVKWSDETARALVVSMFLDGTEW